MRCCVYLIACRSFRLDCRLRRGTGHLRFRGQRLWLAAQVSSACVPAAAPRHPATPSRRSRCRARRTSAAAECRPESPRRCGARQCRRPRSLATPPPPTCPVHASPPVAAGAPSAAGRAGPRWPRWPPYQVRAPHACATFVLDVVLLVAQPVVVGLAGHRQRHEEDEGPDGRELTRGRNAGDLLEEADDQEVQVGQLCSAAPTRAWPTLAPRSEQATTNADRPRRRVVGRAPC